MNIENKVLESTEALDANTPATEAQVVEWLLARGRFFSRAKAQAWVDNVKATCRPQAQRKPAETPLPVIGA
jgi:hypothetical protein